MGAKGRPFPAVDRDQGPGQEGQAPLPRSALLPGVVSGLPTFLLACILAWTRHLLSSRPLQLEGSSH